MIPNVGQRETIHHIKRISRFENAIDLPEPREPQAVLTDVYDGDYLMFDLMARTPEIMFAVMSLFHEMREPPPAPRTTKLRGASGEATEIMRRAEKSLGVGSVLVEKV